MSVIIAEELRAGYILGDPDNDQYLYMPGSEIGVDDPMCILRTRILKPMFTSRKLWRLLRN